MSQQIQEEIRDIQVSKIEPNPYQYRKTFIQEDIDELADSLVNEGQKQPIKVFPRGKKFCIIYGEKRWRAAKQAGIPNLQCIVVNDIANENILETTIIENFFKTPYTVAETANIVSDLKSQKYTHEKIGRLLGGKSKSYVSKYLKVKELIDEIVNGGFFTWDEISRMPVPMGNFYAIATNPLGIAEKAGFLAQVSSQHISSKKLMQIMETADEGREEAEIAESGLSSESITFDEKEFQYVKETDGSSKPMPIATIIEDKEGTKALEDEIQSLMEKQFGEPQEEGAEATGGGEREEIFEEVKGNSSPRINSGDSLPEEVIKEQVAEASQETHLKKSEVTVEETVEAKKGTTISLTVEMIEEFVKKHGKVNIEISNV